MNEKRQFKIISPVEGRDGKTAYWMRCGNAFENKDSSVNIYLDAVPKSMQLQLRELTPEEIKEREDKRASYASRGSRPGGPTAAADRSHPALPGFGGVPPQSSAQPLNDVPF